MKKIKGLLFVSISFFVLSAEAQRKELKGKLIAKDEVEGIHILNATASKYAISDIDGSFTIIAKSYDTLVVSGLKYQNKEVVITKQQEDLGVLSIYLEERITALDTVMVGLFLTGSLESDLQNSDAETEVNFYDLGIPGNTNLPLTQNERKLHDADAGSWGFIGFGGGVNLHKLLNRISGRTKKLRAVVNLDKKDECITNLRENYESILFEKDSLALNLRNEYFMFCQEDSKFLALCTTNNQIELLEFLQQKLVAYRENRKSVEKD
ncbi:MAG: hypothetical protein HRU50_08860 [Winogradskyella sp.]|uniref:hypothetical protein n=1 Tax=Winogradskyella sp. TaxID=1883156 RepID=UPI0025EAD975|nr:hypothetical protein [Winogradskyella sp.]NRB60028.1 hypothetical protein [Winogradskyella sp.]